MNPCHPNSETPCDDCDQPERDDQCCGVCKIPADTAFILPEDLLLDEWMCKLIEIDAELRCKRSSVPGFHFCKVHMRKELPEMNILNQSDNQNCELFLSEIAVLTLDLVAWQQFLASLDESRVALLDRMQRVNYNSPGVWLRLALKLANAALNLNPMGKLPLRLRLMSPDAVLEWKSVGMTQPFNVQFLISIMLRINEQNMKDATVLSDLINRKQINPMLCIPEDMLELLQ